MAIAQAVSGFTLGQADLLRRAMGKKIKKEMDDQKEAFVKGAEANGVEPRDAASLFDKVAKFAEYGFNKSHAAAYALISYQTAWLKRHHPSEYLAAFLSYDSAPATLALVKKDMEAFGIPMLQPCVRASRAQFAPERDAQGKTGVRFGLGSVNGISANVEAVVAERVANGPYADLAAFAERAGASFNSGQVTKLAEVGAFDGLEPVRARAAAVVTFLAKNAKSDKGQDLFGGTAKATVPKDMAETPEWGDRDEREFGALGFYLREHPLERNVEAMKANKVRRRASIISYLRDNNLADINRKKLHGLVESVKFETSRRGLAYLRIQFAELDDKYWVSYFAPPDKDVTEVAVMLDQCKRLREPVVLDAKFVLMASGEYSIACEHLMTEDAFLKTFGSHARRVVTIDPRTPRRWILPSMATVREAVAALDEELTAGEDEEKRGRVFECILKAGYDVAAQVMDAVEHGLKEDGAGDEIEMRVLVSAGNKVFTVRIPTDLDGRRFVIDQTGRLMLNAVLGVTEVRRYDAGGQEMAEAA